MGRQPKLLICNQLDLAELLDNFADIIDDADEIEYAFQAADYLREMAKYARDFKLEDKNGIHET